MNFVWLLGSGSNFEDEEIRYSIRSVLKYHPDSTITIVGELPKFYSGDHYYYPDETNNPYVNVWKKMEYTCTLFDEWICMNDDFYLLEPFKPKHYYYKDIRRHTRTVGRGKWGECIKNTAKLLPDTKRWTIHSPLPIVSKDFISIALMYPDRHNEPVSPRTVYCHHEDKFDKVEMKDVKHRGTINYKIETPFFSIANNFGRNKALFNELYPDKCKYEK